MNKTLSYYADNSETFIAGTVSVDFSAVCDKFLSYLPCEASILDYGCGSGRDTKYFIDKKHTVDAIDGSPELCDFASKYTGIPVKCELFQDLDECNKYDGIWACSSILHVPKNELPDVFARMIRALKPIGYIYTSFKYGDEEWEKGGRFFSNFTVESFNEFIKQFDELCIVEEWVSADVRPGRGDEKWLNLIIKKSNHL